jgi:hypothetical protein
MNEEVDDPLNDKSKNQNEDELRQFMLGEVDDFVVPSSLESAQIFLVRSSDLLNDESKGENSGVLSFRVRTCWVLLMRRDPSRSIISTYRAQSGCRVDP